MRGVHAQIQVSVPYQIQPVMYNPRMVGTIALYKMNDCFYIHCEIKRAINLLERTNHEL